jgi:phage terminase small subunit
MLTDQKVMFVEEYIKLRCKNMTQAAINAGYSPRSASSQASQLLKNTEVSEYLEKRKDELANDLRQEFIFDALEARKVMYEILKNPESDDKDRIACAKDFLDRAGFKPTEKQEIQQGLFVTFEGENEIPD